MAISVGELEALIRLRDELTPSLKAVSQQLSKTGQDVRAFGSQVQAAGSAMLPLSAAVAAAGAGVVKLGKDFETSMTRIETLSGESAASVGEMRQAVLNLAPAVGIGPVALSEALRVVTSTGIHGAEALDILRAAAKSSAVGMGDTKDVARALTAAIAAYGKENLTASTAAEVLFKTVREGGAEADEVAGALGRVVGITAQVGVSFQEVGTFIATFTRLGVDAEEAVTALRGVMTTLLKPSEEAKKQLAAMGTSVEALRATIKERGLTAALVELVQRTNGNADAMAAIVPNVRALAGILGTAGRQAEAMADIQRKLSTSSDDLGDAFARTGQTLDQQFNQRLARAEAIAVKAFGTLKDTFESVSVFLDPVLDGLDALVAAFGRLPPAVKAAAAGVAVLVAAGAPLLIALGSFIRLAGFSIEGLAMLGGALSTAARAFGGTAAAAASASAAIGATATTTAASAAAIQTTERALKVAAGEQLAFNFAMAQGTQALLPFSGALTQSAASATAAGTSFAAAGGWAARNVPTFALLADGVKALAYNLGTLLLVAATAAVRQLPILGTVLAGARAAAAGLLASLGPIAAALAALYAAIKIGQIEQVKNSIAEWALSADNLTAQLYRLITAQQQLSAGDARAAVIAHAQATRDAAAAEVEAAQAAQQAADDYLRLKLRLQGATSAQIEAAVAAAQSGRAVHEAGESFDQAAARVKTASEHAKAAADSFRTLRDRIAGADVARDIDAITRATRELGDAGQLTPDAMRGLAIELKGLQAAGADLPAWAQRVVAAYGTLATSGDVVGQSSAALAQKLKDITTVVQDLGSAGALTPLAMRRLAAELSNLQKEGATLPAWAARVVALYGAMATAADGSVAATASLSAELADAQRQLAALTATQRADIKAGVELQHSTQEIATAVHTTTNVVELYKDALQKQAETERSAGSAARERAKSLAEIEASLRAARTQQLSFNQTLDQFGDEAVKAVGVAATYGLKLDALSETAKTAAARMLALAHEMEQVGGGVPAFGPVGDLGKELDFFDKLFAAKDDAETAFQLRSAQRAVRAAELQIATDQRIGASHRRLLADTEALEAARAQISILSENRRFELESRSIDRTSDLYAVLAKTHADAVERIVEDWQHGVDLRKAAERTFRQQFDESLSALASAFQQLAQIAGGTFSGIARDVGVFIASVKIGGDSGKVLHDNLKQIGGKDTVVGLLNVGTSILGIVSAFDQATQSGNAFARALKGAAVGARVGEELAGPVGAAIGAGIGALAGALRGIGKASKAELEGRKVADDFRKGLVAGLSDLQRRELNANLAIGANREWTATTIALRDAYRAVGKTEQEAHDAAQRLWEAEKRGGLAVQRVMNEINDVFAEQARLADDAKTFASALPGLLKDVAASGGLVSDELQGVIDRLREAGQLTEDLRDFVSGQATAGAGGLAGFLQIGADAIDALAKKQDELSDLRKRLADADERGQGELKQQIAKVTEEIDRQRKVLQVTGIASQDAAEAVAAGLFGVFEELQRQGQSVTEALAAVQPGVLALQRQLERSGISGGAAFTTLRRFAALMTDEIGGPAVQAILSLNTALTGLHNAGLLDQATFGGLAKQVAHTFDALVAQGKDGDAALRLIQPTLQTIWTLQRDFGLAVDDATQRLLDQAVAAGLVGEQHRTVNEKIAKGIERLVALMEAFLKQMGVALPDALDKASAAIDRLPQDVDVTVHVDYDVGDVPSFDRIGAPPSARGREPVSRALQAGADALSAVRDAGISQDEIDRFLRDNPDDAHRLAEAFGVFHQGGMVWRRAHQGWLIGSRSAREAMDLAQDEVPIIAQTGEAVLSRRAVGAAGGPAAVAALNRGEDAAAKVRSVAMPAVTRVTAQSRPNVGETSDHGAATLSDAFSAVASAASGAAERLAAVVVPTPGAATPAAALSAPRPAADVSAPFADAADAVAELTARVLAFKPRVDTSGLTRALADAAAGAKMAGEQLRDVKVAAGPMPDPVGLPDFSAPLADATTSAASQMTDAMAAFRVQAQPAVPLTSSAASDVGGPVVLPALNAAPAASVTYNISGISITVNGANKSPEQLARELWPAFITELRRNTGGTRSDMESMFEKRKAS